MIIATHPHHTLASVNMRPQLPSPIQFDVIPEPPSSVTLLRLIQIMYSSGRIEMAARMTSAGSIIFASKERPRRPDRLLPSSPERPSARRPGLAAVSDCTGFSFHRQVYLCLGIAHRVFRALAGRKHLGEL